MSKVMPKKNKYCSECDYAISEVVQTQQGIQRVMICSHPDARDLVSGEAVPCGVARRETVYCGFEGKLYKEKEHTPILKEVPKEEPLILLGPERD